MASYSTSENRFTTMVLDGIYIEVTAHVVGWYSEGDSWGYGCEPPEGDEEVDDVDIELAYVEETGEDVEITESLKEKVKAELNRKNYW